jgi:hypothetical protein
MVPLAIYVTSRPHARNETEPILVQQWATFSMTKLLEEGPLQRKKQTRDTRPISKWKPVLCRVKKQCIKRYLSLSSIHHPSLPGSS